MDITCHIEYLSQGEFTVNDLCMDKVFIELLHIVTSNNIVSIHGSYFYEDYSENEFYSFEGMEELLDGLLQLSYGEHHIRMVYFVEKIEQAIRLYKVIHAISIL